MDVQVCGIHIMDAESWDEVQPLDHIYYNCKYHLSGLEKFDGRSCILNFETGTLSIQIDPETIEDFQLVPDTDRLVIRKIN